MVIPLSGLLKMTKPVYGEVRIEPKILLYVNAILKFEALPE